MTRATRVGEALTCQGCAYAYQTGAGESDWIVRAFCESCRARILRVRLAFPNEPHDVLTRCTVCHHHRFRHHYGGQGGGGSCRTFDCSCLLFQAPPTESHSAATTIALRPEGPVDINTIPDHLLSWVWPGTPVTERDLEVKDILERDFGWDPKHGPEGIDDYHSGILEGVMRRAPSFYADASRILESASTESVDNDTGHPPNVRSDAFTATVTAFAGLRGDITTLPDYAKKSIERARIAYLARISRAKEGSATAPAGLNVDAELARLTMPRGPAGEVVKPPKMKLGITDRLLRGLWNSRWGRRLRRWLRSFC